MSWFSDVVDFVANLGSSPSSNGAANSNPSSPGPIVADKNESTYGWGDLAKDAFKIASPLIVSAVSKPGKIKYPDIPDSVKNDPRMQGLMGSYGFPNNFPVFKEPSLFQQNFPAMFQIASQTILNRTGETPTDTNTNPPVKTLDGKIIDPETGMTQSSTSDPVLSTSFNDFIINNPDGSPELEKDKQTRALSPSTAARLDSQYGELMDKAATDHNIDPVLLRSIVLAESGGVKTAYSNKGAIGLGQLMPDTAAGLNGQQRLSRAEIEDPATNLSLTAKYIAQLSKEFDGDYDKMISAYNAGPGAVKSGKAANYDETRKYSKQVRRNYLAYTQASRRSRGPTIDEINHMSTLPETAVVNNATTPAPVAVAENAAPAAQLPGLPGPPAVPGPGAV